MFIYLFSVHFAIHYCVNEDQCWSSHLLMRVLTEISEHMGFSLYLSCGNQKQDILTNTWINK